MLDQWLNKLVNLHAEYLAPLKLNVSEHRPTTSVLDHSLRMPLVHASSYEPLMLTGSREGAYWMLVLEQGERPYHIVCVTTAETLEQAFQQLNEELADKWAEELQSTR